MGKKEAKAKKADKTVLVFGAHSDDFVIGAGGTAARYKKEGRKVISVIFSYGEKSHPWLKEKFIRDIRVKEAIEASKILGCKALFFDLEDTNLYQDYQEKNLEKKLIQLIKKEKPIKIFTHSSEDPHPDHKAVNKITLELWEQLEVKPEVYVYSVWNPVSSGTKYPSLYEDISQTFSLKLKALKLFHSQRFNAIYPLILAVFYRAIRGGWKIKKRFGEKFYRIK